MVDYFAVFGLTRRATDAEIREAYRRLAKLYHPDTSPHYEDRDAARRMQQLNEAKSVLFDPIRREEHRVLLGLREKISAERLAQLRAESRFQATTVTGRTHTSARGNYQQIRFGQPRSKWDRVWRKWLGGIIAASLLVVAILVTHEISREDPAAGDPIQQIIARYQSQHASFQPDAAQPADTLTVTDDTLPALKRHGDILFTLGEYRSATKYYEKYLKRDTTDESVITNLSFAYFKRGRYAESLNVLSKQMHGDSSLVVAYYNIGELFLREEKPFDARNAFEAAVKVADSMKAHGRMPPAYTEKARDRLARLE